MPSVDWLVVGLHATVVVIIATLLAQVWRRRSRRGATLLVGVLLSLLLWNGGRMTSAITTGRWTSLLAMQADYAGAMLSTLFAFLFFLEFTGHEDLLTRRRLIAAGTLPALDVLAILTNPLHDQFFVKLRANSATYHNFEVTLGPFYQAHLVFSYVLVVASFVLVLGKLIRARSVHRRQSVVLLLALLSPVTGHALSLFGVTDAFFAPSLGLNAIFLYVAFVDFQLLDVTPVARATVLERLDVGVAVIDDHNQIVDVNSRMREITGIDPDEQIVGEHVSDVLSANLAFYQRYRDVDEIHEVIEVETETGPVWIDVTVEPFEDRLGRRVGRIFMLQDVTERERRERELRRKNDQLEDLASVVSHDLRNPLQVAAGNAEMLDDSETADRVVDALDRMTAIIEDVLTLVREGNEIEATDPVALDTVAGTAWEYVEADAATLDARSDLVIEADEPRLQRLLENLFRNARDHVGSEVTIRVRALDAAGATNDDVESGTCGFYVEDDGPGIPPEERDAVFEAGHTTDPDGSGLGLSIVESIAHAHGWDVALSDGGEGGARFEFTGVVVVESAIQRDRSTDIVRASETAVD